LTSLGAAPRGIIARLRHHAGPLLPAFLRRVAARMLSALEKRRGAAYEIAGERVRFLSGSAPIVVTAGTDGRHAFDALQLSAFAQEIQRGDVVADVGSYRGTYAVIAAARTGAQGRVFAFEPTAANAELIAANIELNRFTDRVVVERAAVSDRTGTAEFYAWGGAQSNSLARPQHDATTIQVRTVALDDYFRNQKLPRVLKIDIEGAELLALRGAQSILASDARIICELHPYAWPELGYGADDLRALLEQYGRYAAELDTGREIRDYKYGAVWLNQRG
jgi:FkbM family methyltransferase